MLEWRVWRIHTIMDPVSRKNTYSVPGWRGIRVRLVLFLIILLALSLIIFNLFSMHQLKSHFLKNGREENLELAQKITAAIEESMEAIIRDLFSISRIWPLEGESISDRHADLESLKDRNEDIRLLSISDIQGNKLLTVSRRDNLSVDKLIEKAQGDKIESFLKGTIYISNVYPVTQALPLVDISVPLRRDDQNQVKGFLSAVISLKGTYRKLEAIERKEEQEFYLMDTNGLIVAHFSPAKGENTLGIKGLIPLWDSLGDIQDTRQYISGISEGGGTAPLIYKNLRGRDMLGVISVCPKLRWNVIVEEPVNEVLEPIIPILKKNIIISVLVFIFVSILAIFFNGYILSPLIRLNRLTENLGVDMEMFNKKGRDEIARIGQNMDQLIKEKAQRKESLPASYKESEAIRKRCEESNGPVAEVKEKLEVSEESLKKEKRFTKKLIDSLDFLIVVLDLNGNVLISNKSCERKTGYNHEEIIGKNWFEMVYPPGAKSEMIECFHKLVEGHAPYMIEERILTKDRNFLYIQWHLSTINDSEGMLQSVVLAGEDITLKQKRQNELEIKNLQLLKNNEDLENILSIVSHDLKNPLYIIQDFASILLQEYNGVLSEDGLYYIERIKTNAKNMERLILDLLELSRVSRSKGILQECSISDLIQRSLEEFRQVIRSKGIEIRISGTFPVCFCEPERILQVFMNLLSNSIKFMQDARNPVVEIGYKETQEEHEFFVRDNGIGIEREYHEKIFVIFQRLQDVRDVEGTGVGLTIVKKIIETHGGRVWVESEKGRGATFYFTIPKKISGSEVKEKVPKVSSA
ncbi:MAG: ATP-binding protein [bacterium]